MDHMAPVWRLLPPQHRGRFLTDASLVAHARARGVDAEAIDAQRLRSSSAPPRASREDGPAAFVVSIGDTKVARRLGYRRFAFMEHGAGQAYIGDRDPIAQRHPSYAGGLDREDVELFLVPNEYSAGLWRRSYPGARVEVVGSPKLEDVLQLAAGRVKNEPPVVAISFHWPAFTCDEAGSALGHYLPALPALAAAYHVIGHSHPKADWPARIARYYRRAGIPFVADFADVVRQADLYICDNSSTLFEFAATGRPVLVLNDPKFRRNVHHGGRFWDWATVGIQVDQPDELLASIARALADPPEVRAERERVLELVYPIRAGAGARAAAAIADWLTYRASVAA